MSQYRFVGQEAAILDTPYQFTRFGQLVEMPDDLAHRAVREGIQLLPAKVFDELEFSPGDLTAHASTITHDKSSEAFRAQKQQALAALDEFRRELAAKDGN